MIYISCALYMEAAPFIRRFHCNADVSFLHGRVFLGEQATVIVTGTGMVAAAIALTEALTRLTPKENDLFVNIGVCGCSSSEVPLGETFLIHKLTDGTTGRDYYPDMLFLHSLREAALITVPIPQQTAREGFVLYDTEATALYLAALPHFSTDRLFFFKTVSDHCNDLTELGPTDILTLMQGASGDITELVLHFSNCLSRKPDYSITETACVDRFCEILRCSVTMELELRRLVTYYEMERGYAIAFVRDFLASHNLSLDGTSVLNSRKEGKQLLEEFRHACME